jgi:hypothetical protein
MYEIPDHEVQTKSDIMLSTDIKNPIYKYKLSYKQAVQKIEFCRCVFFGANVGDKNTSHGSLI